VKTLPPPKAQPAKKRAKVTIEEVKEDEEKTEISTDQKAESVDGILDNLESKTGYFQRAFSSTQRQYPKSYSPEQRERLEH